jgi:signal transduction histidine kinase
MGTASGSPRRTPVVTPKRATSARSRRGARAAPTKKSLGTEKKSGRDPLLSAICHDLRAPLAAVTMGANFVLQTLGEEETDTRPRRILEAMLRSCAQMERLVRNFADLSEIEGHAVQLRLGVHDAGEMLDLAAEAAEASARARAITLSVDKPEKQIHVRCDRERMLRAIHHLVDNAIKHAPEGSTVILSVSAREGQVSFRVLDHGPGLTPQTRRNLFDRGWHAKRANRVGAGFGLAITRGFAQAHHGKVTVESKPGSTSFEITLPNDGQLSPRSASLIP